MKKILKLFLHSIKSFDGDKRPEEVRDWKELMDNLVLFLLFEVALVLLLITPFILSLFGAFSNGDADLLLSSFYLFTIANLVASILLTIMEVIIIFVKKRKSYLKDEEREAPDWSIRLKAWSYEHPPWV